jgi:hypothetical protein
MIDLGRTFILSGLLVLLGGARAALARPLTLQDAFERATRANPSLKAATAVMDSATARIGRAAAAYELTPLRELRIVG